MLVDPLVVAASRPAVSIWPSLVGAAISLIAGGLAGALISTSVTIPTRFWSRYNDLGRIVMDKPHLYPLWDHAADPTSKAGLDRFQSEYNSWRGPRDYMGGLSIEQRMDVLLFLEMWGDFAVEMRPRWMRLWLGSHSPGLTHRAVQVAELYDVFPGDPDARRAQATSMATFPEGRNGIVYGRGELEHLGLVSPKKTKFK